jgi:hypothetical protein
MLSGHLYWVQELKKKTETKNLVTISFLSLLIGELETEMPKGNNTVFNVLNLGVLPLPPLFVGMMITVRPSAHRTAHI